MMFCHACGDRQKDAAKFCGSCGTPLLLTATQPEGAGPATVGIAASLERSTVAKPSTGTSSHVAISAVTIKGTGPDRDGDVNVECEVDIAYSGSLPVPLVRLRWVALDGADGLPLHEAEGFDCQSEDLEAGEERTVSQSAYVGFPKGTEGPDFEVRSTVLLYPVEWQALGLLELPAEGRAEHDEVSEAGPLQVTRWWAHTTDADNDSVTVNVGLYLRNAGDTFVSMAMARCLVQGRKGQPFANELAQLEGLAPGEERLLTATVHVSEDTRSRKGARLLVKVGTTELPVVVHAPVERCIVTPTDEDPDEDDESEDEDADSGSGDEDEQSDEDVDEGKVAARSRAADRGPVECVVICEDDRLAVKAAVFYTRSEDWTSTWIYYAGDDGVGGVETGFMCRIGDDEGDLTHFYQSVDGESFTHDALSGDDVAQSLRPGDREAFDRLLDASAKWLQVDTETDTFVVRAHRREMLVPHDEDPSQLQYYGDDVDHELLAEVSSHWAVQFQFSFE